MKTMTRAARTWALVAALIVPGGVVGVRAESDTAVLVMAHGGSSQWNKTVKKAVKGAQLSYPYRVFLGMATE